MHPSRTVSRSVRSVRPSTQTAAFSRYIQSLAPKGYTKSILRGRKLQEKIQAAFDKKLNAATRKAAAEARKKIAEAAEAAAEAAADEGAAAQAAAMAEAKAKAAKEEEEAAKEEDDADGEIASLALMFGQGAMIGSRPPPYGNRSGGRPRTRRNRGSRKA